MLLSFSAPFVKREAPLQAGKVINDHPAIQMINFVKDRTCQQALSFNRLWFPIGGQKLNCRFSCPGYVYPDARKAETALLLDLQIGDFRHTGVDHCESEF